MLSFCDGNMAGLLNERSRWRDLEVGTVLYPRAKASKQANLITKENEAMDFILRVVESLALEVQPPSISPVPKPEMNHKTEPPAPRAKISVSRPKISPVLSTSRHKGKVTRSFHGDNKTKARASSAPRPRAVISSPDNDDLIGNQNLHMARESKPHSSSKNMQSENSPFHKSDRPESLSSTMISKDSGFYLKVPELRAKVPSQHESISRIPVRREKSD